MLHNYGTKRLQECGLANIENLRSSASGQIVINYLELWGDPLLIDKDSTRTTNAIECPDRWHNKRPMVVTRTTPEEVKAGLPKYFSPKKAGTPPYFTTTCRHIFQNHNGSTSIPLLYLGEGELKCEVVSNKLDVPSISFKGINSYKLCFRTKSFISKTTPRVIYIGYDGDYIKEGKRGRTYNFYGSAINLTKEILTLYKELEQPTPEIYLHTPKPDQPYKGVDDVLLYAEGDPSSSFFTKDNNEHFFCKRVDLDPKRDISNFFGVRSFKKERLFDAEVVLKAKYHNEQEERNYLLDILQSNDYSLDSFFGHFWEVDTNMGKSTTALLAAKETQSKVVFSVPNRPLADQLCKKATNMGLDSVLYYGNKNEGSKLNFQDRLLHDDAPQVVVTTYASSNCLYDTFYNIAPTLLNDFNFVMDEIHNTTTSASKDFQLEELNSILDISQHFKTFTGLTGTPLFCIHPILDKMSRVIVDVKGKEKVQAEIVPCKNVTATTAKAIQHSVASGKIPVVLFNNKTAKLDALLHELGSLSQKMLILNADTKTEDEQQKLIDEGFINGEYLGIIATSVLKEGISINNKAKFDFIQVGQFHNSISKQFSERARNALSLSFTVLVSDRFSKDETQKGWYVKTSDRLSTHLNIATVAASAYDRSMNKNAILVRKDMQRLFIRETSNGVEPDYLAIQHQVMIEETTSQYSSRERLTSALRKYFKIVECDTTRPVQEISLSGEAKGIIEKSKDEAKAEKEKVFNNAIGMIEKQTISLTDNNIYIDYYFDLCKYARTPQDALKILKSTKGNVREVKLAINRLRAKRANFEGLGILGESLLKIQRTFVVGESYHKDDIKRMILAIVKEDTTFDSKPLQHEKRMVKVLKFIRYFYEVKRCGKDKKSYKIMSLPNCY